MKKLVLATAFTLAGSGAFAVPIVVDDFSTFLDAATTAGAPATDFDADAPPNGAIGDRILGVEKVSGLAGLSAETSSLPGVGLSLASAGGVEAIHTLKYGAVTDLGLDVSGYNAITFDVFFLDLAPVFFEATLTDSGGVSETDLITLDATAPPGYANSFNLVNFTMVDLSDIDMIEFRFDGLAGADLIIEEIAFEVPVPAALPLAVSALGLLGLMRLRRSKS